jgi:hypothetical protein
MQEQEHRERLAAFVIRLRRVLASPLAQDDEQMLQAHKWSMIALESGDVVEVGRWLPDEQQLESLGARIRPLFLKRDPVYCHSGLNSMGFLLARRSLQHLYLPWRKALKGHWTALDEARGSRYFVQVIEPGQSADTRQDSELARSWFYNDLIHADLRHEHDRFNIEERFAAAFGFVADVVKLCWRTFALIFLVRKALALPDKAWDTEVVVEGNRWSTYESPAVYVGEVATEVSPDTNLEEDPNWRPFSIPQDQLAVRGKSLPADQAKD